MNVSGLRQGGNRSFSRPNFRHSLLAPRPEVDFAGFAEAFCGVFGGDVALGHAEHFEADHEFTDGSRAQQGRIEVGVEVPLGVGCAVCRGLMEAHGVRKAGLEKVVEADGDAVEGFGEAVALSRGE